MRLEERCWHRTPASDAVFWATSRAMRVAAAHPPCPIWPTPPFATYTRFRPANSAQPAGGRGTLGWMLIVTSPLCLAEVERSIAEDRRELHLEQY